MRKYLKQIFIILPFVIILALGYFLWRGLNLNPRLVPSPFINKATPEFNLPSLFHPNEQLSNKIFKGHVSLLNVWATWCATCADEYPILVDIARSKQVKIYGLDYKDNREAAINWIKQYGNPFVAVGFDSTGSTAINWGVYGTPETFLIDKNGVIRDKIIGEITPQIWQKQLLPLIKKL